MSMACMKAMFSLEIASLLVACAYAHGMRLQLPAGRAQEAQPLLNSEVSGTCGVRQISLDLDTLEQLDQRNGEA